MSMKRRVFVLVALLAVGIDPGARSAAPDPGTPGDSLQKLAADEAEQWARQAADLEKQLEQAKSEAATLRTRVKALEVEGEARLRDMQELTEKTADLLTAGIYIYRGPEGKGHEIFAHEFGAGKMDFAFWRRGVEDAEQGRWEIGRRVCNKRFGLVLQGRPTGDPPHPQGLLFERVLCVP